MYPEVRRLERLLFVEAQEALSVEIHIKPTDILPVRVDSDFNYFCAAAGLLYLSKNKKMLKINLSKWFQPDHEPASLSCV
jgi:hypothetical protein